MEVQKTMDFKPVRACLKTFENLFQRRCYPEIVFTII